MRKVEKIDNEDVESIKDLFTEWYNHKDGYKKDTAQFLKDEKLDRLFTVQDYGDLIREKAVLPETLASALAQAAPFNISAEEMAEMIWESHNRLPEARCIELSKDKIYAFYEGVMALRQVIDLRNKRLGLSFDPYPQTDDASVRAESCKMYMRMSYLFRTGVPFSHMSDAEIKDYGKPEPMSPKERELLKAKKHRMKKHGIDVASMSSAEIISYKSQEKLTEVQLKENRKIYRKTKRLERRGIDSSKMARQDVLDCNLHGKKPVDQIRRTAVLYQRKQNLKSKGVDVSRMSLQDMAALAPVSEFPRGISSEAEYQEWIRKKRKKIEEKQTQQSLRRMQKRRAKAAIINDAGR